MLKVLLLDDKKSIIEGITVLIEWEKYGFEITAAFRKSDEALEFIKSNHVDLVITDIRMPGMSGLELIETVKQFKPQVKFIIISGYAEFEYVKQAIDRKVDCYLLKPVDEDELIAALGRVKEEIEDEKKYVKRRLDEYIRRFFSGDTGVTEENIFFESSNAMRYVLIRAFDGKCTSLTECNCIEKINEAFDCLMSEYGDKNTVYIGKSDMGDIEILIDCSKYRDNILHWCLNVGELLGNSFVILVGKESEGIEHIRESRESVREIKNAFMYETDKRIMIYEKCKLDFSRTLGDMDFCKEAVKLIKSSNGRSVDKEVEILCMKLKEENVHPDTVMMYIYSIIFEVADKLPKAEEKTVKFFYRYSQLKKTPLISFGMLCGFMKDIVRGLSQLIEENKEKSSFGIVGEIVDYINENYQCPDLKLQTVADKYFVNSGYLGKLFTERVGVRFNTYLLKIRIEKSKELLRNSNLKIYEVAQRVGFNDPNYFSVKFAELENTTPLAYRENER